MTSAIATEAAEVAEAEGLPLVVVLASTGADIVEGIDALEGWGRLAKAIADCSGIGCRRSSSSTARRCPGRRCCSGSPTSS